MKSLAFAASCVAIVGCFSKPPPPGATQQDAAIGDGGNGDGPPPAGAYQLAVTGAHHICALSDGALYCWGDNSSYQLGDGTTTAQSTPLHIGTETWTALASRYDHTCAIDASQRLYCWGSNNVGQANNKATPPYVKQPSQLDGFSETTFVDVATSKEFSCAVSTSGALWCFGDPPTGHAVSGFHWATISTGSLHACGIATETGSSDPQVYCFGVNDHGQVGQVVVATPPVPPVNVPTRVPSPSALRQVPIRVAAGDDASCAIFASSASDDAGELWCWGSNSGVPDGGRANAGLAVKIGTGMWRDVQLTNRYMCAVDEAGDGRCWGTSEVGQLGDGLWTNATLDPNNTSWGVVDRVVPLSLGASALSCMQRANEVICAGDSEDGQFGFRTSQSTPVEVAQPNGQAWRQVFAGTGHVCATDATGALYCWGNDTTGEVAGGDGHGTALSPCEMGGECVHATPTAAPITTNPETVVMGNHYTCARDHIGSTQCWGDASRAQIGTTTKPASATFAVGTFADLVGGPFATCGRLDNAWACWGDFPDSGGQFVDASPGATLTALDYIDPTFGSNFMCARRNGGERTCFGANSYGQLSTGTSPTTFEGAPGAASAYVVMQVRAAAAHACEIRLDGQVFCWGRNTHSCITPGIEQSFSDPRPVTMGSGSSNPNCTALALGRDVSCALCDGRAWCWGGDRDDVLGRGGPPADLAPDQVSLPAGSYSGLAVTDHTGCAVEGGGKLYCWGHGAFGELGDGSHAVNLPIALPGPH